MLSYRILNNIMLEYICSRRNVANSLQKFKLTKPNIMQGVQDMRKYDITEVNEKVMSQAFCNCCGREMKRDALGYFEDYLHVEKKWNYFSQKDGEQVQFDLCEECLDKMIENFVIPVEKGYF